MIGLNVIFFVMTMIMVVCGCLIHFYFSKLKNLFGLSNCLTPKTGVVGVKQLLDPNYFSFWKKIEMSILEDFHPDWTIFLGPILLIVF